MQISFGRIGVCVADYTKESLFNLLVEHELDNLIDDLNLTESDHFNENTFLQSDCAGPYRVGNTLGVHDGFIRYVIDMENFILILRVGILDPDAANSLVEELYSQGLIVRKDK